MIWKQSNAERAGAAISYYALFSFAPFFLIAISIAGTIIQKQQLENFALRRMDLFFGQQAMEPIRAIAERPFLQSSNVPYLLGSILLLFIGASGFVLQLQYALNRVLETNTVSAPFAWRQLLHQRLLSLMLVIGTGFVLAASFIVSSLLGFVQTGFQQFGPDVTLFFHLLYEFIVGVVLIGLLALMYRILPYKKMKWSFIIRGAGIAVILFLLGRYLIGLYLVRADFLSVYGAAGAFMVMMIWIYYLSQIFLFGGAWIHASSDSEQGAHHHV